MGPPFTYIITYLLTYLLTEWLTSGIPSPLETWRRDRFASGKWGGCLVALVCLLETWRPRQVPHATRRRVSTWLVLQKLSGSNHWVGEPPSTPIHGDGRPASPAMLIFPTSS